MSFHRILPLSYVFCQHANMLNAVQTVSDVNAALLVPLSEILATVQGTSHGSFTSLMLTSISDFFSDIISSEKSPSKSGWCIMHGASAGKHSVLHSGDGDVENSNGKPFLWALNSVNWILLWSTCWPTTKKTSLAPIFFSNHSTLTKQCYCVRHCLWACTDWHVIWWYFCTETQKTHIFPSDPSLNIIFFLHQVSMFV